MWPKNGKDHDWRRNWSGSSKSIESDIAVEMLHKMKEQGFHVKNLVMDNDSTTITRAKSSFGSSLKKISDFNYTKKNFTSKLYDLKKAKEIHLVGPKDYKTFNKMFRLCRKVKFWQCKTEEKPRINPIPCLWKAWKLWWMVQI